MGMEREYPEEVAGPFPEPPQSFVDREGRRIELRPCAGPDDEAFEGLVEMYATFDPADRAQGIPPASEERVRTWLESILGTGQDVIALHEDRVVGHGTLVPDDGEASELAIFVHQDYQNAGIGSRLIRALLGAGRAAGVRRVWLTVERWNHPAIHLYESVGFEPSHVESFELEMALRLGPNG